MRIALPATAQLFTPEMRTTWAKAYLNKNHHEFNFLGVQGNYILAERKEDYQHLYKGNR